MSRLQLSALSLAFALASASLLACATPGPTTSSDKPIDVAVKGEAPFVPASVDLTPARDRLDGEAAERYTKLAETMICPCEGYEDTSLATCLANADVCHTAEVASDTLAFHIGAGRPPALAFDQAVKDFMAASEVHSFETAGRPRHGNADAAVQVVLFADFQCPYCRSVAEAVPTVLPEFGSEVSVVFKHFPLPRHPVARTAAIATAAAHRQGEFWALHDAIFEHQLELTDEVVMELAAEVGLDVVQLRADMDDPAIIAQVDADIEEGKAADLPGTPTIYVNGVDAGEDLSAERLRQRLAVEVAWVRDQRDDTAAANSPPPGVRTTILAQDGGVPAAKDAPSADVYPVLADIMGLLDDASRARLVELTKAEICPCPGTVESLDKCLRGDEGGCRLAVRVTKLAMRNIMEGESDSAVVDAMIQEIEAARKVYEFDLENSAHKGADPAKAKLTVVEFADFKCGYCAKASEIVHELAEKHKDDVTFYYKNFPLNPASDSPMAARAVLAAGEQGKFWELHDLLFAGQSDLSEQMVVLYAEQLGLDMDRFKADLASDGFAKRVAAERAEGENAKISGTPAFFINGVRFNGNPEELGKAIEDRLAETK